MHPFITSLKTALQTELPGYTAQLEMAPGGRGALPRYVENPTDASVLILFYEKEGKWLIPFIQRPNRNPKDPHNGQIAFPGGRYETEDKTYLKAALREAQEEVGVIAEDVHVLGALTPLYIPISGYLVHPFVGYLPYVPDFVLQKEEVHSVIEAPLLTFQTSDSRKHKDMTFRNRMSLKNVAYFDVEDKVIWGATAMMMSELLAVLKDIPVSVEG